MKKLLVLFALFCSMQSYSQSIIQDQCKIKHALEQNKWQECQSRMKFVVNSGEFFFTIDENFKASFLELDYGQLKEFNRICRKALAWTFKADKNQSVFAKQVGEVQGKLLLTNKSDNTISYNAMIDIRFVGRVVDGVYSNEVYFIINNQPLSLYWNQVVLNKETLVKLSCFIDHSIDFKESTDKTAARFR